MTDVVSQMPIPAWRGIQFPITNREFGFQHDQTSLRFLFRDEQIIESIGRENPTYRYRIPFGEDIVRGPFKNLFVKVYPQFLNACLDRTNGLLEDPVHGTVQVKCQSLQETLDANSRDGVAIEATFVTSPDDDFDRTDLSAAFATLEGAKGIAGFFDREATKIDDATKKLLADLNRGAGFGEISVLDFATSAVDQVTVAQNKLLSQVGTLAFKAQKFDQSLARLKEPKQQSLRNTARRLEQTARDLVDHAIGSTVGKNKTVRGYAVPADIGRLALSSQLHTEIGDFLKLNPSLGRAITVRAHTRVLYYVTGDFATVGSLAGAATGVPTLRSTVGV